MGLFETYLLTEAGLSVADKANIDNLNRQIETIDKNIAMKLGPKGKFMLQTGDMAGHINDKDPEYVRMTNRRAMLLKQKKLLMSKENKK